VILSIEWPYDDCTVFKRGDAVSYISLRGSLLFWHPGKKAWLKSIRPNILKDARILLTKRGEYLSSYLHIANELIPNFAMAVGHKDGEIGLKTGYDKMIFGGVWTQACRDHIEMESYRNARRLGMDVIVKNDQVTLSGRWGTAKASTVWEAFLKIMVDNYIGLREALEEIEIEGDVFGGQTC